MVTVSLGFKGFLHRCFGAAYLLCSYMDTWIHFHSPLELPKRKLGSRPKRYPDPAIQGSRSLSPKSFCSWGPLVSSDFDSNGDQTLNPKSPQLQNTKLRTLQLSTKVQGIWCIRSSRLTEWPDKTSLLPT